MAAAPVRFLIVGSPRSGTTLVQRLAAEIDGVAVPVETHFFTKGVQTLAAEGPLPLAGAALRRGLERYASLPQLEGARLDVDGVLGRLGSDAPPVLELFDAIVGELAAPGAVLGEKTPGHLLWAARIAAARPALRVVGVVRDPRAVVVSQADAPWGGAFVDLGARRWRDDQEVMMHLRAALGERMLVVRYEDVVADPAAVRTGIAELLDRPDVAGTAAVARLEWETWKESADAAITADRVDAWADRLAARDVDRIASLCGHLPAEFGYEIVAPGALRALRLHATSGRHARRRRRGFDERRDALRQEVAEASWL